MTKEQKDILKALGIATKIAVNTPCGESDLIFTLKTKGVPDYEVVGVKAAKIIRKNYGGVIEYDDIPKILQMI